MTDPTGLDNILSSIADALSEVYPEGSETRVYVVDTSKQNGDQCCYIYQKGKNSGLRCSELSKFNGYCIKHRKHYTEYQDSMDEFDTFCKVCLENKIAVISEPCNHVVMCIRCSTNVIKCPVCRCDIKRLQKVFFS